VIIDTSALIAMLRHESDWKVYADAVADSADCRISAANFVESACIIDGGRSPIASRKLDELIKKAKITIEPVSASQALIARAAYRDFGKGSGHPAKLNFGDCFAYALAKDIGEPLLFKGSDFSKTDIEAAIG